MTNRLMYITGNLALNSGFIAVVTAMCNRNIRSLFVLLQSMHNNPIKDVSVYHHEIDMSEIKNKENVPIYKI